MYAIGFAPACLPIGRNSTRFSTTIESFACVLIVGIIGSRVMSTLPLGSENIKQRWWSEANFSAQKRRSRWVPSRRLPGVLPNRLDPAAACLPCDGRPRRRIVSNVPLRDRAGSAHDRCGCDAFPETDRSERLFRLGGPIGV
jgi:hypothetical protein